MSGTIITFYSYKGGTGRSMSLANVACLLARQHAQTSDKVLLMDWDLEAPGLHRYFAARSEQPENSKRPGVINLFIKLRELLEETAGLYDQLVAPEGWKTLDSVLSLEDYLVTDVVLGVDLIKAGQFDSRYSELVAAFDWADFYQRYGAVIRVLGELLCARYAYCLIDSRTGVTDVSGICTMLLPEKLVAVFTPNNQSLYGLLDVIEQAIAYRRASDDFRPLSVFPLPSRIELAEKALREQWRKQYQHEFETLFRRVYQVEAAELNLTAYFDEVQLPHVSYYAYGENIAVLEERNDALSLSRAYQEFFRRVIELDEAWEPPDEVERKEFATTVMMVAEQKYDVFISYNSLDKDVVQDLATRLEQSGVHVYLAEWYLRPGEDYQKALEKAMDESEAIAVAIGPDGLNPWDTEEAGAALRLRMQDPRKRIIPVILPAASPDKLPNFLKALTYVDFREGLDDTAEYSRLVSGITDRVSESYRRKRRPVSGMEPMPPRAASAARLPMLISFAAVSIILLILAIVGIRYYVVSRPIDSIAVVPFMANDSDPATKKVTQELADEIGERVNAELSDLPGLTVQSFSAMQRYKGPSIDPRAVGRELNVGAVMVGWVTKRDSTYTIRAELIRTSDGSLVVSPITEVNFSDVLLVPNKIVAAVSASEKVGIKMNADEKRRKDAEKLCVNGRNAWNKRTAEGFNDAIKNYNEALALDPKSAEALTGLADCYNFLPTYGAMAPRESYPKAHDAAIKALTIDPQHGEAHASLGYTTMRSDWNAAEAENEFKLAIGQDPAYSSAHQWYANLLVTQGRADEAEAEVRRAQDLDKTSLIVKTHMANIDYYAHRYDQSIAECQKVIAVDPSYFVAHRFMGLSYAQKGMYKEALAEAEKAIAGSSTSSLVRADYASTLALSGDTKRTQDELNNLLAQQKQKYVSAFHIAFIYACLKDKDRAFEWLEKAYQERNDWLVYLNVDPRFDSLHSDPRFADLWSRIKAG